MEEKELVQKFEKVFKNNLRNNFIEIGKSNNQSVQADIELEYNEEYVKLEAKVFNDTRNNSGNFSKIFGQTLFNRYLYPINNKNNLAIKYGFLFDKQDVYKIQKYIKKCDINDLVQYGQDFEVEYVFIYDDNIKIIIVIKWIDFIKIQNNDVYKFGVQVK